ncbi:MAG TPA: glycosyltransferase [Gemmataceae bacterium]|nr:glycosyltransferase [Gemmataceae bacterium]
MPEAAAEHAVLYRPLVVLLPVFNDWTALRKLLVNLDAVSREHGLSFQILIVDDGSTMMAEEGFTGQGFPTFECIDILRLRRNLGHQRAIAVGLAYVEDRIPCEAVILMDSDGEDDPRDVPRLLQKYRDEAEQKIIFAERTKRSETCVFQLFYSLFKLLHFILTSRQVRVGNFSVIPAVRLASLAVVSEMWNHYAAAVYKSRQPLALVPTQRSQRLDGKSKMGFTNLVIHGLSAISVYSDTIGVRLLVAATLLIGLTLAGLVGVVAVGLVAGLAIPAWATLTAGTLLAVLFQAILFSLIFSFLILGDRQGSTFLPLRDYRYFVDRVKTVYQK